MRCFNFFWLVLYVHGYEYGLLVIFYLREPFLSLSVAEYLYFLKALLTVEDRSTHVAVTKQPLALPLSHRPKFSKTAELFLWYAVFLLDKLKMFCGGILKGNTKHKYFHITSVHLCLFISASKWWERLQSSLDDPQNVLLPIILFSNLYYFLLCGIELCHNL